jgi:homogentisate phytyltransferase/homogentisate geranylgeranyltransferase
MYPHTIIGTTLSVLVNSHLAFTAAKVDYDVNQVAIALVAALSMNVYIVGINQCYDVEIDKVNKPYLPLASGDWSMHFGWCLVIGSCAASLLISYFSTSALLWTVVSSGILGTAYSVDLPFLRWKQHPLIAACCIFVVRGFVVQWGFYAHLTEALKLPTQWNDNPIILLSMMFVTILGVAIALCKDVPDMEGDEKAGVRTATVRLGKEAVLKVVVAIVVLNYAVVVAASFRSVVSSLMHITLGATTIARSRSIDIEKVPSIRKFYMHIWVCFYLEYFVLLMIPTDLVDFGVLHFALPVVGLIATFAYRFAL